MTTLNGALATAVEPRPNGRGQKAETADHEACAFLRKFHPQAPWVLTAIIEGKIPTTATFQSGREASMLGWIARWQKQERNIYFLVGEPESDTFSKKAEKSDIAAVCYLWCDLDCSRIDWRNAEIVAAEMGKLRAKLDAFPLPPTVIINSGGGLQAFWKLSEPAIEHPEETEAANKALAVALGGDHCHNIDRIMRLPGTTNYPNKKKREAGRVPVPATLALFEPGRVYSFASIRDQAVALAPVAVPAVVPQSAPSKAPRSVPERLLKRLRATPADGDRSSEFFAVSCALFDQGLDDAGVIEVYNAHPAGVAAKYLERGDLAAEVERCRKKWKPKKPKRVDADGEEEERKPTQADNLVRLASEAASFFASPDDIAYAKVEADDHHEVWGLKSRGFKEWLVYRYYRITGVAPKPDALNQALCTLNAMAKHDGDKARTFTRTATLGDKLYLDLCDEAWRAVEISTEGWRVVNDVPVHFLRSQGMLPLPAPEPGGDINELKRFLNVASEADFQLLVAWLLAALRHGGPYPVLALIGEGGTSKTSTARLLRSFVDPHAAGIRRPPASERNLFIGATKTALLCFDNLSAIPEWLSDALCVVATGGTFTARELHSDAEEVILSVCLPVAITSVGEVIARSDLASRAMTVTLAPIPEAERKPEAELNAAIDLARPRILGALLDAMSHGLRELPNIHLQRLPRMADFIRWTQACEGAFWEQGSIHEAFDKNAEEAVDGVLESDAVAVALMSFLDKNEYYWRGKGEELLTHLSNWAPEGATRDKSWPRDPTRLSSRLTLASPSLRQKGISVSRGKSNGSRWIEITGKASDQASYRNTAENA